MRVHRHTCYVALDQTTILQVHVGVRKQSREQSRRCVIRQRYEELIIHAVYNGWFLVSSCSDPAL